MQCYGEGVLIYKALYKCRAAILDRNTGLQEVYFSTYAQLSVGSYITYTYTAKRGVCFVDSFKIEDMPIVVAREDISFLHYLCEIVYSFMPMGKIIEEVFEQMLFLFSPDIVDCIYRAVWKKYFIARLLFLLGIYTQEQERCLTFLSTIAQLPIDRIDIESLDLAVEQGLDQWLLHLFVTQPRLNELKITYFTSRHRNI